MRNTEFTYIIEFDFTPTDTAYDFEGLIDELKENIKHSPEVAVDELVANIDSNDIIISLRDNATGRMTTVWPSADAWKRINELPS